MAGLFWAGLASSKPLRPPRRIGREEKEDQRGASKPVAPRAVPRPSYRNKSRTKDMRLLQGSKGLQDCLSGQSSPIQWLALDNQIALGGWAESSLPPSCSLPV